MNTDAHGSERGMTRRQALRLGAWGAALATTGSAAGGAETKAPAKNAPAKDAKKAAATTTGLVPLNRFGRMMQEYYVARVRVLEKLGIGRRARIRTKAEAEGYVREVREKIRQ